MTRAAHLSDAHLGPRMESFQHSPKLTSFIVVTAVPENHAETFRLSFSLLPKYLQQRGKILLQTWEMMLKSVILQIREETSIPS